MCIAPTTTKKPSTSSLITTMMLFARALSLTPSSSSQVMHHHDRERREVEEDRDAGDARRGVHQRLHRRIGAERDGAIAVRQPARQVDAEAAEQRVEVAAPGDGDGDVADRVLEDQIPADDPRDQLAERRVRIRVGAARLRNHRRQLRVAERRKPADGAEQDEREDQRGPGRRADDLAVGPDFAGRRGADRREDAGADHGADRQHHQIARAEHALQRCCRRRRLQSLDRLAGEELRHARTSNTTSQASRGFFAKNARVS